MATRRAGSALASQAAEEAREWRAGDGQRARHLRATGDVARAGEHQRHESRKRRSRLVRTVWLVFSRSISNTNSHPMTKIFCGALLALLSSLAPAHAVAMLDLISSTSDLV